MTLHLNNYGGYHPRGEVIKYPDFVGYGRLAVRCALHPEVGWIFVDWYLFFSDQNQYTLSKRVNEAFDRCEGCVELEKRKEARKFKQEASKTRWPDGAEL